MVRIGAARALGRISDKSTVRGLIELLIQKEPSVRGCAASILKEITKQDFGKNHDKWKKWYDESGKK